MILPDQIFVQLPSKWTPENVQKIRCGPFPFTYGEFCRRLSRSDALVHINRSIQVSGGAWVEPTGRRTWHLSYALENPDICVSALYMCGSSFSWCLCSFWGGFSLGSSVCKKCRQQSHLLALNLPAEIPQVFTRTGAGRKWPTKKSWASNSDIFILTPSENIWTTVHVWRL